MPQSCLAVTYVSRPLLGNGDTAEDEGIAVVFGGSARFTDTFEQLPYGSVLPLSDKPLAGPHVHRLGLQLKVLQQEEGAKEKANMTINQMLFAL